MAGEGHLFIVLGDITALVGDAMLGAESGVLDPRRLRRFQSILGTKPHRTPCVKNAHGERAVGIYALQRNPGVATDTTRAYVANIDRIRMVKSVEAAKLCVSAMVEYVEVAAFDLTDDASPVRRPPVQRRAKHLLLLPLLGTGFGGARSESGAVIRELLCSLRLATSQSDVDVALTTNDGPTYAALQAERMRLDRPWPALRPALLESASVLARHAFHGRLTIFVGAGVSTAVGLPTWPQLLKRLAKLAGIDPTQMKHAVPDLLDQATLIERRLRRLAREPQPAAASPSAKRTLEEHVAAMCSTDAYSLAHALIASLPVKQYITTNYDQCLEKALTGGRSVSPSRLSVLPHAPMPQGTRVVLKMHGDVDHPSDIILTREQYSRYSERHAALRGIVQAALSTQHMLFVGFGLMDPHFFTVVDSVRRSMPPVEGQRRGTALSLWNEPLKTELFAEDIDFVCCEEDREFARPMSDAAWDAALSALARRHDILLDCIAGMCAANNQAAHLLQPRFSKLLNEGEAALAEVLRKVLRGEAVDAATAKASLQARNEESAAWGVLERAAKELGAPPCLLRSPRQEAVGTAASRTALLASIRGPLHQRQSV